jgi:hypothetical protein
MSASETAAPEDSRLCKPDEGPRRRFPSVVVVVLGLLLGLAVALLAARLLGEGDGPGEASLPVATAPVKQVERAAADEGDVWPGAGATSAEAAVTGFLDAEVAGDFERSFGFLSAEDRRRYGSPAGWVGSHADVLPPVGGFEIGQAGADEVVTVVDFEPGLDQVTGLTPARARITWQVDAGPGGMGVVLDGSDVEPLLPADDGAVDAARRWVGDRQACQASDVERPGLIGSPALANALCDATGQPTVGEPDPLGDIDATVVATAFGPEAASAARVVRIAGPAELGAVLVPVGERWTVIGVVP